MALGSINQSKKIQGPANVFLVPYPVGGYTGATDALRMTNILSQFFSDSATGACRALVPSVYSEIDAKGVEVTLKQAKLEFDSQNGKYPTGNAPTEASVSWSFKDIDAAKLCDIFSAITGDTISTAAAAGVAGRKIIFGGRQSTCNTFALMVRYVSEIATPQGGSEYRHFFLPFAAIQADVKLVIDKKGPSVIKVTAMGIPDYSLQGGQPWPPTFLTDDVIAAAIS